MTHPLVSVVVPVYNGERYLRQALESALGQTYRSLEIVVVDDGSTDGSPQLIASFGSRLRSLRQANGGVALARNSGIRAAHGELIAFLDQDDWWMPEKIEKQVALFLADERLGLAHTAILQYSDSAAAFVEPVYLTHRSPQLQGDCFEELLLGNAIFNSSTMIRKNVLQKSGTFDPGIPGNTVQDYDLWLRIARHFPFAYLPQQLTALRLHDGQGTLNRLAMLGDELRLLERIVSERQLRDSPALRARFAELLDELGVAHLDNRAHRLARQCFIRALRTRWSARMAVLSAASFLPPSGVAWLRRSSQMLRA
jgi:glycosyltransferase involved in cell wall biosynthesis